MESGISLLEQYLVPWSVKILLAFAIFFIGNMLAGHLATFVTKLLDKSRMDVMLVKFLSKLIYTVFLVAVTLAAIDSLGISVTSLLTIVGAAGLAVGLALKDSLSNFAAGVMIVIFQPFKIGDLITAGGSTGVVDEIGMFCTVLHSVDNLRIIMPNSAVIGGTIINTNALPTRRIDLLFGISYSDNIDTAKQIIKKVLLADNRILKQPLAEIGVAELAASKIVLFVRPWVNSDQYVQTHSDLLENILTALQQGNITLPFPQQDVHLYHVEKK